MNPPISQFLNESFDRTKSIAVVAGQRDYPKLTVEAIRKAKLPVKLIALKGETDLDLFESFPENDRVMIKVGQIGKMLKALKKMNCGYAIFVGQVSPGKLFKDLTPDIKAVALLAKLKERNAHTIFGAITEEITKIEVEMLDARAFIDDSLSSQGIMTSGKQKAQNDSLEFGIKKAKELAALDIGQGIVVRKGTVLAVEAFEGTDDMLARANKYRTDKLIFIKTSKPGQNPYFDWPVFGEKTLQTMIASGITTAALEADKVVMLNKEKLIETAEKNDIEIIGWSQ